MIRAAFFDLDGTLVSRKGICTTAVREALASLQRNGIMIFAATGRAPTEFAITGMLEGLNFDAIVALNGQLCYDNQGIIHRQLFDQEDLIRLLEQAQAVPFPCMVVEQTDMYINFINEYVRFALKSIHTPLPDVRNIASAAHKEVLMLMAYLPTEETEKYVIPALKNSCVTRWNQFGTDIVPTGCSKRTGIETVLKKYNLTWDEVIAFGDGENDYEMLKYAKYGVAMGNADPMLLNGDFYITESVECDGAVSALKHFGLI